MKHRMCVLGWVLLAVACGEAPHEVGTSQAACSNGNLLQEVDLPTGVTLQYVEQGSQRGPAVIFIHGYTDSHRSFDLSLPLLSPRYHVFALDLRGHGGSSQPDCCYTQADFTSDIVAFMDVEGLDKATLVGHSMGSLIAHKVALEHPDRVERLVLIGSAPTLAGNEGAMELKAAVDLLEDPIDPAFVYDFQASTFYRPIPQWFLPLAVNESLKLPADIWKQVLDGLVAENHAAELENVAAPTLIVWGDQDQYFTAEEQAQLDESIPDSKLVVHRWTGHASHVEVPRRFVRDLHVFLRANRR